MSEASTIAWPGTSRSRDRLFSALVQCLHCSGRRLVEIRRGDYGVLRRDGTVNFTCPDCGDWTAHRLIRISS